MTPRLALPVLLLALAGCSGGDPVPSAPPPTPSVLPGTSEDGFTGAREDVEGLDCRAGSDGWAFSGTVTNPTDEPVDYRVYVALVDDAEQVRQVAQVDVDGVGPGERRPWEGAAAVDDADLRCVLRVERAPAG